MTQMHPLAQALNDSLSKASPEVFSMLSALGKRDGMRAPLASGAAGDECDLAIKGAHCGFSSSHGNFS